MQCIESQEIECIELFLATIRKLKRGSSALEWKCKSSFSMLFSYPTSGNKPEVEIPSFEYTPSITVLQQPVKINRHSGSHAVK